VTVATKVGYVTITELILSTALDFVCQ